MICWNLEWAERLPDLERIAAKGQRVPALESRPTFHSWLSPALECFTDQGGAPTWSVTLEWARQYGIEFEPLWFIMQHVTGEVRKWQAQRHSKSQTSAQRPSKKAK